MTVWQKEHRCQIYLDERINTKNQVSYYVVVNRCLISLNRMGKYTQPHGQVYALITQ